MKNLIIKFVFTLIILTLGSVCISAQDNDPEAAEGLDLYAVAELFKDSENLEKFEQNLNSPESGINNLDLNDDDEIDFIRVVETVSGDTRLIVLQTALGEDDFQDVAVIAVEQENGTSYNLQLQGDATIYGENYYVVPANNNFSAWNVVKWLFRPNYRAYVSPFGFKNRPRWWNARRPVAFSVYRNRTNGFVGRRNFVTSKSVRVKTISKVNYRPRTSVLVTKRTKVTRTTNRRTDNQTTKTKTKIIRKKRP
jgi:hypothetical protein